MTALNKSTILNLAAPVEEALAGQRISEALSALGAMAGASSAPYALSSRIAALTDSYAMLSRCLIDGLDDPQRGAIAADISAEASEIKDTIKRTLLRDSAEPSLYLSTVRFEDSRPADSITALTGFYTDAIARGDSASSTEAMATRLFNRVWTTFPLSAADTDTLRRHLAEEPDLLPAHTRTLLIGALALGAMAYFDHRRAIILADIYRLNHTDGYGLTAFAALMLTLVATPRHATGSRKLTAALAALDDIPTLAADTREMFMLLLRSHDTERVNRKISDELIPEIMKMKPDIERRISDLEASDSAPFDEDGDLNPDWEALFDRSGLGDKLRELSEMQDEGADMMMSSTANLKDFPFFNEPANWFLPFYTSHSLASGTAAAPLAAAIENVPTMSGSDKYSLVLLASMRAGMFNGAMARQFEEQQRMAREMKEGDIPASTARTDAPTSFIRDAYRFFKLFRRKGEFADPFMIPLLPSATPVMDRVVASHPEAMAIAAEFLFRRGHYGEALPLLLALEDLTPASAELYQKKGYALEQLGRPDEAFKAYDTADIIDSGSVWTLRRLATLSRRAGHPQEALSYYDRIQELRPDKYADVVGRAAALEDLRRASEALAQYYKADWIKPDRPAVVRALVRCQLITGEYDKALASARRLLALPGAEPGADDHLLRGHAALATASGGYHEAVEAYAAAVAAMQFDTKAFIAALESDSDIISRLAVDPLSLHIIAEAAIARAASLGAQVGK